MPPQQFTSFPGHVGGTRASPEGAAERGKEGGKTGAGEKEE